jgi:hypothetical protein
MPQNTKGRTRSGLSVCIIVIMATLVCLSSGACAPDDTHTSYDGQVPAAAEGPPLTLREVLSQGQLATVALLDCQTPFPSASGKAALFVDGDFYAQAEAAVKGYVREQAEAGVPVALFGDQAGFEALRTSVGAAADLPAEPGLGGGDDPDGASGSGNPTAAVRGLKVYPGRNPDELPGSAAVEIAGSPDGLAPLVQPMIRWAEDCAEQLR